MVGSGIGFALNLFTNGELFVNAEAYATLLSMNVILFYVFVVLIMIFLISGIIQMIGAKSRVMAIISSLFPLGVGMLFILLNFSELLGIKSAFFAIFFIGEQYGNTFPILFDIGGLGIGVYVLLVSGVLGLVSGFMSRE
ncbi:MAG: hypothetical protein ACTSWY_07935 [Promethearchaeota archaeon]